MTLQVLRLYRTSHPFRVLSQHWEGALRRLSQSMDGLVLAADALGK
jgi:hypothetical protein